jgi:ferric-dicitrate binding protein FerR (iron transport regulator)
MRAPLTFLRWRRRRQAHACAFTRLHHTSINIREIPMAARKTARKTTARRTTARKTTGRTTKAKRKYSPAASRDVELEMRRYNRGTAKSGRSGRGGKVKSRKQAIAIGLSKARKQGKRVPRKAS